MTENPCTRCYHYYVNFKFFSGKTEKLCSSPHLGKSPVDKKNNEVSAEYERSCEGKCGPDGKYFELCYCRTAKGFWGSAYDKDAPRIKASQIRRTSETN